VVTVLCSLALCSFAGSLTAQANPQQGTTFEIYGFVMTDAGFDFRRNDPLWFDVVRPTKLPAFENEFGEDGQTFWSVRQTRFGVKSSTPTRLGTLSTTFEWEMFGTGVDAGQTTLRLRHAYGELGEFGAGQYWSPFMDIDVFPNSIEYWGPTGMAFFRNVQVRWMPVQGDSRVSVALERPGASGDQGIYRDRIELDGISPRFPVPDLSAEGRYADDWGYVELAGILRWIEWDDLIVDAFDLEGDELGWGLSLSSNLLFGTDNSDIVRLQAVYGEAIQNYMNDAPVDIGIRLNPGNLRTPVVGEALSVLGLVAFLDHRWNEEFTSAIGWSFLDMGTTPDLRPDFFESGHYALANVLWTPIENVMMGGEFQYGSRKNLDDDFHFRDFRIQFSFKYNFARQFGGG
jgi:hypothetical protein